MGAELTTTIRGGDDLVLEKMIKQSTDGEFAKVVQYGAENCVFKAESIIDRSALIKILGSIDQDIKDEALSAACAGNFIC